MRASIWAVCCCAVLGVLGLGSGPLPGGGPPRQAETHPLLAGGGVRGITVGPIENALHDRYGYGSDACAATMRRIAALGGNWVSITPFGRIWDLSPSGIDLSFEAPFHENRARVASAIRQAHARGLSVMLVPHLWVETGGWRGELAFDTDEEWERWAAAYRKFVLTWARLARETGVELFSVGVELRSWVTTSRAPSFSRIIEEVREVYPGPLTYAANWDDALDTTVWGSLDAIGINAFFPLAESEGERLPKLLERSLELTVELEALSDRWQRPILFTEVGYTARPDPALRPWEWPEDLGDVPFDPEAQAEAYTALLEPMLEQRWFVGFFVWRFYADSFDTSQEPVWGFSPLHKPAERVLRSVFRSRWAVDRERFGRAELPAGAWL